VSELGEALRELRAGGDPGAMAEMVPFARFLGIHADRSTGELLCRLAAADHIVGNPMVPALHGGAIGALLEMTAMLTVLWTTELESVPRTVTITFDYLRPARPVTTWAAAKIVRHGRRVMTVQSCAWQEDRARWVAAATAHLLV
jgi:uncharacterized protein (TIGR00369 family)